MSIADPPPPAIRKILHINSPAPLLRLVEKFCQTRKIAVESMESGSAGLHHALVKQYQLILVGSPPTGILVTRFLKGLLKAEIATPVLVMTETRLLGKTDFSPFPNCLGELAKPLDLSELSRYLELLGKPVAVEPQEMEKLLAILRKWEVRMSDAV